MRQLFISTLLSLIFSLNVIIAYSQTSTVASKELTWTSGEATDKSNSQRIQSNHRLVTHGQASMDLHRGNEQTLTFSILSVKGEWGDEKEDGVLEYSVRSANNVPGKVTLQRTQGSIKAWVDFTQTNQNGLNVEFKIDTIE